MSDMDRRSLKQKILVPTRRKIVKRKIKKRKVMKRKVKETKRKKTKRKRNLISLKRKRLLLYTKQRIKRMEMRIAWTLN